MYLKDPTDPQWTSDEAKQRFDAFITKYAPGMDKNDYFVVYAYAISQTMVKVLDQCGNNLTRANIMQQASNLKDFNPDIAGIPSPRAHPLRANRDMRMVRLATVGRPSGTLCRHLAPQIERLTCPNGVVSCHCFVTL